MITSLLVDRSDQNKKKTNEKREQSGIQRRSLMIVMIIPMLTAVQDSLAVRMLISKRIFVELFARID